MKKLTLFISVVLFIATSCSIEKRHYMKGFHVKKANFHFYDINKSEPLSVAENDPADSVQINISSLPEEESLSVTEINEAEKVNNFSLQKIKPDMKLFQKKKIVEVEINFEKESEIVLLPDSTHKSHVKQNKKNMSEQEGEDLIESLIGTEAMLSFCLLLILLFVFNPTIGMVWFSVTLTIPMAIVCVITSLFLTIKALFGLISGWYTAGQRKNIKKLLLWAVVNFILAAVLTTLLIAMFA